MGAGVTTKVGRARLLVNRRSDNGPPGGSSGYPTHSPLPGFSAEIGVPGGTRAHDLPLRRRDRQCGVASLVEARAYRV
jgi:hypothetical protein